MFLLTFVLLYNIIYTFSFSSVLFFVLIYVPRPQHIFQIYRTNPIFAFNMFIHAENHIEFHIKTRNIIIYPQRHPAPENTFSTCSKIHISQQKKTFNTISIVCVFFIVLLIVLRATQPNLFDYSLIDFRSSSFCFNLLGGYIEGGPPRSVNGA